MTQINASTVFNPAPTAQTLRDGASFVLAAGITGRMLNPLGAGPNAFASLGGLWMLSLLNAARPQEPPQAQWTATTGANGRASIDLGDGYSMQLNENNSEITIRNAETGETTRIWGDPHVDVDGKRAFDFWGTTTFTLENGTKVTIDTEQWGGNPDAYVASQVTITKGDQAIVVDGISQNEIGDLSISMSQNGRAIDAATRDGFVLEENASGSGWRSTFTGQVATQADLNATRPGQAYGPGSGLPSIDELSNMLSAFLGFGALIGLGASLNLSAELNGSRRAL